MTEEHIMQMHRDGVHVSIMDIARATGMTRGAVSMHLTRAMKKMRQNLPKIMKEMGIKNAQVPDIADSADLD